MLNGVEHCSCADRIASTFFGVACRYLINFFVSARRDHVVRKSDQKIESTDQSLGGSDQSLGRCA